MITPPGDGAWRRDFISPLRILLVCVFFLPSPVQPLESAMRHLHFSVSRRIVSPRLRLVSCVLGLLIVLFIGSAMPGHADSLTPRALLPLIYKAPPPPSSLVGPLAWRWVQAGSPEMVVDWDGDGQTELVAHNGSSVYVLRHTGAYDFNQVWSAPAGAGWGLGDVNSDGRRELWTVDIGGQINSYVPDHYIPTPLKRLTMPAKGLSVVRAVGADLLGNGKPVLIAALGGSGHASVLAAYRLPDLQLLWQAPITGDYPPLLTAQLDRDPQLEIVVQAQTTSLILDGATGALQWQYGAPFSSMATGDIDGDRLDEIVIDVEDGASHRIAALDVDTRSEKWSRLSYGSGVPCVGIGDVTGDSVPELLIGQWVQGTLWIQESDIITGQVVRSINVGTAPKMQSIYVGDLDMDGKPDLVWDDGHLRVTPADETTVRFTQPSPGPQYRIAALQMDADPAMEMIIFSDGYGNGRPFYQILDGSTMLPERSLYLDFDVLSFPGWAEPLTVNLDGDPWPELLVGIGHDIYKFDHNGKRLAKATANETMIPVWAGDVDGDGINEVVTYGDKQIAIHRADNLLYKWQSPPANTMVEAAAADVDRDGHVEIIFHDFYLGPGNIYLDDLQVYDGATHQLQWQMSALPSFRGLTVGDVNGDGTPEILTGERSALNVYNGATRQLLYARPLSDDVYQLAFLPLINSPDQQLVITGWTTVQLFGSPLAAAPLQVIDGISEGWVTTIDRRSDGHNDLVISAYGRIELYPATESRCDEMPLVAMTTQPAQGQDQVSRDAEISAVLSDSPLPSTLTGENVSLAADGAAIPASISYETASHTLRLTPTGLLPADAQVTVKLGPGLRDRCGNSVFANGATANTYQWTFRTGSGVDRLGPAAADLSIAPTAPWAGMMLTLLLVWTTPTLLAHRAWPALSTRWICRPPPAQVSP
jgi:hypothetical protein